MAGEIHRHESAGEGTLGESAFHHFDGRVGLNLAAVRDGRKTGVASKASSEIRRILKADGMGDLFRALIRALQHQLGPSHSLQFDIVLGRLTHLLGEQMP
jgi:hypothetical protein